MKLIILGPQASGKGTQASMISEKLDIPHISTGDIFRENIKKLTELGKLALTYINKGELVPDEVTNRILLSRIRERDCENGFILDGFPRNIFQAEFLAQNEDVDRVIEIHVSDKEAIKRISGRRTCEKCGAVYSLFSDIKEFGNACKKCGGQLKIRDDDKESSVRRRLDIYHEETEPLIEYYKKKNLLLSINGERPIEKIFEEIIKKI